MKTLNIKMNNIMLLPFYDVMTSHSRDNSYYVGQSDHQRRREPVLPRRHHERPARLHLPRQSWEAEFSLQGRALGPSEGRHPAFHRASADAGWSDTRHGGERVVCGRKSYLCILIESWGGGGLDDGVYTNNGRSSVNEERDWSSNLVFRWRHRIMFME